MTIIALFLVSACAVNNQATNGGKVNRNSNTNATSTAQTDVPQTLLEYLRRVPGVQVSGTENNPTILVRNSFSIQPGSDRPLFVVDGTPVGNEYSQVASMVAVNDIKSITVLKDVASTSAYGIRGAAGVIVIRTKTGRDR